MAHVLLHRVSQSLGSIQGSADENGQATHAPWKDFKTQEIRCKPVITIQCLIMNKIDQSLEAVALKSEINSI